MLGNVCVSIWYVTLQPLHHDCTNDLVQVQNALKYTSEGHIHVSLKMLPANGGRRRASALLTIADSGKGMSREFLDHQLFRAFTQEDDLTEGTGLGMSMVGKIVKGLGGEIKVQSEKDRGTIVSVTVPLEVSSYDKKLAVEELQRTTTASLVPAILVNFLGYPLQEGSGSLDNAHKLQISTLRKTCKESLNLSVPLPSWALSNDATLALILEADAPQLLRLLQSEPSDPSEVVALELIRSRPLVVVCKNYLSARRLKASPVVQLLHGKVEYVSQPCGPERLSIAFRNCLDSVVSDIIRPKAATAHSDSSDSLPQEALLHLTESEEKKPEDLPLPHLTILDKHAKRNPSGVLEQPNESIAHTLPSRLARKCSPTAPANEVTQSPETAVPEPQLKTKDQAKLPLLLVDDNVCLRSNTLTSSCTNPH